MKISLEEATDSPVPQFIVYPETKEEKMLLKAFFFLLNKPNSEYKFHNHGHVYTNREITSFNFGLKKETENETKPSL
jgi:hypothetical protein